MTQREQTESLTPASSFSPAALRLHVLASGSKGNAAVVENIATGQGILIDCGICKRDFLARCEQAAFDVAGLQAILITHDHSDHTKGLGVVCRELARRGLRPPLLAGQKVRAASQPVGEVLTQGLCEFVPLTTSSCRGADEPPLAFADIRVIPFATSHDAAESFGFRFQLGDDAIGFLTDSGIVPSAAHELLRNVRILALESNHDTQMLAEGPYPWPLKQRVSSDYGHLSNNQAADELRGLLGPRLQTVVAMHISQNNNTYRLPQVALQHTIEQAAHGAEVLVAYQDHLVSAG